MDPEFCEPVPGTDDDELLFAARTGYLDREQMAEIAKGLIDSLANIA